MNNKESLKMFREYASNTLAGTCNNFMLFQEYNLPKTSRIYYRPKKFGKKDYRFCFSNYVDSTYEDGNRCHANTPGGEWTVLSAYAGDGGVLGEPKYNSQLSQVFFSENKEKKVEPGEIFWSDEIELNILNNHYVCFEITFVGKNIPYTPDKIIPSISKTNAGYIDDKDFPQPIFVGIKESRSRKIVFLGDSITQGLGTLPDMYEYWVAVFSKLLPDNYSSWNIGLGCGHASDAAPGSVWLEKAKTGDIVFVCFGVNDIFMNYPAEKICLDIKNITRNLKEFGCKVVILSIPPFDMVGDNGEKWYSVNDYIRRVLSHDVDGYFDTATVLGKNPPLSNYSLYGPHPDGNGGKVLGKALYNKFIKTIEEKEEYLYEIK